MAMPMPTVTTPGFHTRTGHIVGRSYRCDYWQADYTVLASTGDGRFITVRWPDARTTTHCTPRDKRDRLEENA